MGISSGRSTGPGAVANTKSSRILTPPNDHAAKLQAGLFSYQLCRVKIRTQKYVSVLWAGWCNIAAYYLIDGQTLELTSSHNSQAVGVRSLFLRFLSAQCSQASHKCLLSCLVGFFSWDKILDYGSYPELDLHPIPKMHPILPLKRASAPSSAIVYAVFCLDTNSCRHTPTWVPKITVIIKLGLLPQCLTTYLFTAVCRRREY